MDWTHINAQAMAESLQPVRPGIPRQSPFWNGKAKQFIYAPAFEFRQYPEAAHYHFAITCGNGACHEFSAAAPWADLGPVWSQIPVGFAALKVTALNANGKKVGISGLREFYKAAPFSGPTRAPTRSFRECATMALDYIYRQPHVQHWLEKKEPDPGYRLYQFPAKIIGAVINAMVAYASLNPEKKDRALALAINAADYLIAVSCPAGHPLQYLPPTYDFKMLGAQNKFCGKLMLTEACQPCGAYISLAEAASKPQYREAAARIADTYVRLQLPGGSWPLMVNSDTGCPVLANICIPIHMIAMFETLLKKSERDTYCPALAKALAWLMDNPIRDFHWESQFEDIMPGAEKYKSMTGVYAAQVAQYLLDHIDDHPGYGDMARDIIRYAEDLFVIWDKPMPRPGEPVNTPSWTLPCVLEQYEYYVPVDGAAAIMIRLYLKAFEKTRQDLFLAKALALGAAVTAAQDPETGRIPTIWEESPGQDYQNPWLNCITSTALAMIQLDAVQSGRAK